MRLPRPLSAALLGSLLVLAPVRAATGTESRFFSQVPGLSIANARLVGGGLGDVIRGAEPIGHAMELVRRGVTDVVIFKNDTRGEVAEEIAELTAAGIPRRRILAIPFRWRDLPAFRISCEQTIAALKVLVASYLTTDRVAYFHCTMGEDRTGYLAALFRMMISRDSLRQVFQEEMCDYGYEAGDPTKPRQIVRQIRKELTPLFLKMAKLVESNVLSLEHLELSACAVEPVEIPPVDPLFTCGTSSRLRREARGGWTTGDP
jgi:hypothetical protein